MRSPEPRKNFAPGFVAGTQAYGSVYAYPKRQRGVVLILTLIVLVAMTLAAIALVRSVDTGNVVAGNMAFKEGATQAGDAGTEAAIAYLRTGGAGGIPIAGDTPSFSDNPAKGYYATGLDLDMTGNSHDPTRGLVDWDFNNCNGASAAACKTPCCSPSLNAGADNQVTYIITRLCSKSGVQTGDPSAAGNDCVTFLAQGGQSPKRSELKYGLDRRFALVPIEFYRITSRVKGPRNTVSYVETVVHF